MFDWLRRIIYIADVGRRHARQNYPHEEHFIEIPLYLAETGETGEASTPAASVKPNERAAQAPANDPHEPAREIEA